MKKISISLIISLTLSVLVNFSQINASASSFIPNFDVSSEYVYLKNLDTDTVIYQKNPDVLTSPASTAKIMTAIVVLEQFQGNLDALKTTYISAGSQAFDELYMTGASTADFRINEKLSYNDLLYGLMLRSACEAANIMAYNIGDGDMTKFVAMMNEKAIELGCENTTFTNAHGLYDAKMRTTAREMAIISEYAMNLPGFMEIAGVNSYTLEATDFHDKREIFHTNSMLSPSSSFYYQYAKGIKTGTLDEAGSCLVSSASKDGYQYLLVTLNAPILNKDGEKTNSNFKDHIKLFDWAFDNFQYTKLINKEEDIAKVAVQYGVKDTHVLVRPSDDYSQIWQSSIDVKSIQRVIKLNENVIAPVLAGDKLGELEIKLAGETLATIDLVAAKTIELSKVTSTIEIAKKYPDSKYFKIGILIAIIFFVLYTVLYISFRVKNGPRRNMRRKKPIRSQKRRR